MKLKSILSILIALVAVSVFVVSCDNASNSNSDSGSSITTATIEVKMADGGDVPADFALKIETLPDSEPAGTIAVTDGKIFLSMEEVTKWGTLITEEGITVEPNNTKAVSVDTDTTGKYTLYRNADKTESISFYFMQNDVTVTMAGFGTSNLKKGINALDNNMKPITMPTTIYLAATTPPTPEPIPPAPATVKIELADGGALPEGIKFVVADDATKEIKFVVADGVLTLDVGSIKDLNWDDFKQESSASGTVTPNPAYLITSIQAKDKDGKDYTISSSKTSESVELFGIAKVDTKVEIKDPAMTVEYKAGFNLFALTIDGEGNITGMKPLAIGDTLYLHKQ
ncbi:MAG: hypothetical protein ACRC5H_02365 [Treponemataceae bacterium]